MNFAEELGSFLVMAMQQFGRRWLAEKTAAPPACDRVGMAASSSPVNIVVHGLASDRPTSWILVGKTAGVIKSVIERFGNAPEITPVQELGQPDNT